MTYALIDNATLTAVQRATGAVAVKTSDTINGDLCALENFLQGNLFYDDLLCIDNYKAEHRDSRKQQFPYVRFLSPSEFGLEGVDAVAQKEAASIRPEIRGGEFVDEDFSALLEQLKMNMVCTWDQASSVYYLTMRMLGYRGSDDYSKYSALSAAIFAELSDAGETRGRWSKDVKLVSSDGHVFSKSEFSESSRGDYGGPTRQLEMFVASLNWLAYKSIYYSTAAKHLKADSFIHPIRHAYQVHWMKKVGAFGHDFTARLLANLADKTRTSISEIQSHGATQTVALDLPLFSAWLTQSTGSVSNAIEAARQLRNEGHFVTMRETLKAIRIAFDEQGIASGNKRITKLMDDVDKICGDLRRSYGVRSTQGIQGSFLIKTASSVTSLFGVSLPDRDFALSTPEFMKSESTKAFTTVVKDITKELTSMERLGGVRDLMAKSFRIDGEDPGGPKVQEPRFRYVTSGWQKPM
ncbi:hypothetical protein [Pseudomonas fluorescens]|uniref:Uncharacterized protein n=1 Tax=Pseudomonas fluorescens TaxID=294 RepID=A0AAE2DIR6_PSEFL|nr:hypothetical protein [Pseudomonas fluorescens]KIF55719.1 hypothetical protein QS95_26410 [Pseudomonas fluorescens]